MRSWGQLSKERGAVEGLTVLLAGWLAGWHMGKAQHRRMPTWGDICWGAL